MQQHTGRKGKKQTYTGDGSYVWKREDDHIVGKDVRKGYMTCIYRVRLVEKMCEHPISITLVTLVYINFGWYKGKLTKKDATVQQQQKLETRVSPGLIIVKIAIGERFLIRMLHV